MTIVGKRKTSFYDYCRYERRVFMTIVVPRREMDELLNIVLHDFDPGELRTQKTTEQIMFMSFLSRSCKYTCKTLIYYRPYLIP